MEYFTNEENLKEWYMISNQVNNNPPINVGRFVGNKEETIEQ